MFNLLLTVNYLIKLAILKFPNIDQKLKVGEVYFSLFKNRREDFMFEVSYVKVRQTRSFRKMKVEAFYLVRKC